MIPDSWGDEDEIMPCKVCKIGVPAGMLNHDEICEFCEEADMELDEDDDFWTRMSLGDEKYKRSKEDYD